MGASVLLVHDDIAVIAAIRKLLSRRGHEVLLATSVPDAVSVFAESRPEAVMLAPAVAGGTGAALVDELLRRPEWLPTRVIAIGQSVPQVELPVVSLPLDGAQLYELLSAALVAPPNFGPGPSQPKAAGPDWMMDPSAEKPAERSSVSAAPWLLPPESKAPALPEVIDEKGSASWMQAPIHPSAQRSTVSVASVGADDGEEPPEVTEPAGTAFDPFAGLDGEEDAAPESPSERAAFARKPVSSEPFDPFADLEDERADSGEASALNDEGSPPADAEQAFEDADNAGAPVANEASSHPSETDGAESWFEQEDEAPADAAPQAESAPDVSAQPPENELTGEHATDWGDAYGGEENATEAESGVDAAEHPTADEASHWEAGAAVAALEAPNVGPQAAPAEAPGGAHDWLHEDGPEEPNGQGEERETAGEFAEEMAAASESESAGDIEEARVVTAAAPVMVASAEDEDGLNWDEVTGPAERTPEVMDVAPVATPSPVPDAFGSAHGADSAFDEPGVEEVIVHPSPPGEEAGNADELNDWEDTDFAVEPEQGGESAQELPRENTPRPPLPSPRLEARDDADFGEEVDVDDLNWDEITETPNPEPVIAHEDVVVQSASPAEASPGDVLDASESPAPSLFSAEQLPDDENWPFEEVTVDEEDIGPVSVPPEPATPPAVFDHVPGHAALVEEIDVEHDPEPSPPPVELEPPIPLSSSGSRVLDLVLDSGALFRIPEQGTVDVWELIRMMVNLASVPEGFGIRCRTQSALRTLWVRSARLVAVTSSGVGESLVEQARRDGLIDGRQERQLRAENTRSPAALLGVLRERRYLRELEILPLVQRNAEHVALEALTEPETQYTFFLGAPPAELYPVVGARPLLAVVADALRRHLTGELAVAHLGGMDAEVTLRRFPIEPSALGFASREAALLRAMDAHTTVEEALRQTDLSQEQALLCLAIASHLGLIQVRPGTGKKAAPPESAEIDVQRLEAKFHELQEADYFAMLGISRNAGSAEIQRAFERLVSEFHPLKYAAHPDPSHQRRAQQIQELLTEAAQALLRDDLRSQYVHHLRE